MSGSGQSRHRPPGRRGRQLPQFPESGLWSGTGLATRRAKSRHWGRDAHAPSWLCRWTTDVFIGLRRTSHWEDDVRRTVDRSPLVMRSSAADPNGLTVLVTELLAPEIEGQLGELPGEAERHLVVVVVHWGAGIDAHVEGFVEGHDDRNGMRNFLGGDLAVDDLQHTGSALAEPLPVVGKVELNGKLP